MQPVGSGRDHDLWRRRRAREAGLHRRPAKLRAGHRRPDERRGRGRRRRARSGLRGSAFGQNDGEFNVFSTDRQLAALQTAVTMLRPLPEQKSLVYFTSNLRLNGTDNNAQMRATTNAAIRANVPIFPVDARGLVAMAPLGDATQRSPGGIGMFTGALAQQRCRASQRSQDTLYSLAKDTGGKALLRLQRPVARHPAGGRGADQLLHPRLLQHAYRQRRQVPPRAGRARQQPRGRAGATARGTTPTRSGRSSARRRARASARRSADAREPDHRHHHRAGAELLPVERAEYFVPVAVKIPGSELALASAAARSA